MLVRMLTSNGIIAVGFLQKEHNSEVRGSIPDSNTQLFWVSAFL